MSMRDKMNDNQNIVAVVAVVVMVLALFFIFRGIGGGGINGAPKGAYYYNTATKEIFTDEPGKIAPFKNDKGEECVQVHMYTCGTCAEDERFVLYYEKLTDKARAEIEKHQSSSGGPGGPEGPEVMSYMMEEGGLISGDGAKWYPRNSPQAEAVFREHNCPNGKRRKYCHPGS